MSRNASKSRSRFLCGRLAETVRIIGSLPNPSCRRGSFSGIWSVPAGSDAYLAALEAAPEPVLLGSTTPISDCLVPEQEAGQLASIGEDMIVTATKLNGEARRDPGGHAAVELGYLLGAVSKGADPIHTDLVRRLNSSAHFSETGGALPASFERAFGRGYAAGRNSG